MERTQSTSYVIHLFICRHCQPTSKVIVIASIMSKLRLPSAKVLGTTGYIAWYCKEQLTKRQNNEPVEVLEASISSWKRCLNAHCRAGNCDHTKLVRIGIINLVIFIIAHPDDLLDEMAVFIYNEGGLIYGQPAISQPLKELGITKKKASTEVY